MPLILPETDQFDPFKGYETVCNKIGRHNWFSAVPSVTLARNAYYQGFITEWEYLQISSGKGVIREDGSLRWIHSLPGYPPGPYEDQYLTRERIERIRGDQLLGLGDGRTSL